MSAACPHMRYLEEEVWGAQDLILGEILGSGHMGRAFWKKGQGSLAGLGVDPGGPAGSTWGLRARCGAQGPRPVVGEGSAAERCHRAPEKSPLESLEGSNSSGRPIPEPPPNRQVLSALSWALQQSPQAPPPMRYSASDVGESSGSPVLILLVTGLQNTDFLDFKCSPTGGS